MCSFIASATSDTTHGVSTIPMFIYYSMFGFQRVGDFIWALQDMCGRGFLFGATAGRTTLNGEGLQHQDGHSLLMASCYPNVRAYEPAFAYEILLLMREAMQRMYEEGEEKIYYFTLQNENYEMPPMPEAAPKGILTGMYRYKHEVARDGMPKVQLLGSGAIMMQVLRAKEILAEKFSVLADVWSVTSYSELRREALAVERENMLNPTAEQKVPWVARKLKASNGPVIAASDWMKAVPDQISRWIEPAFYSLGTDGLGRSASRASLRRHFEVDAESIVIAALTELKKLGVIDGAVVKKAMQDFKYNSEKIDPATA
jgi:pyruvate dehydrogenase E1 component